MSDPQIAFDPPLIKARTNALRQMRVRELCAHFDRLEVFKTHSALTLWFSFDRMANCPRLDNETRISYFAITWS